MEAKLNPRQVAELTSWPVRTVRYKAKTGQLCATSTINARNRPEYLIPLSALPEDAQLKYYVQHGIAVETTPVAKSAKMSIKEQTCKPLDHYTAAQRERISWWMQTLDQWDAYRNRPGVNATEQDAKFIEHLRVENPGRELSVKTLYRKRKALQENDLDGLVDNRGKARKGKRTLSDNVRKIFCFYYLQDCRGGRKYSIPRCIEYTEQWARKNAPEELPLPEYSTFYRVAMDIPEPVRVLAREGERGYYDKVSLYTRRQYESINSNDWWVGDTYTCDVITRAPDGTLHRPYLSAWVDVRSGIFVGWYIDYCSDSQHSIYALRRSVKEHGVPNNNLYTDNGREYLTFDFGGRGHRAKRVLADGSAPWEPPTIMQRMDVKMTNAIPKNSRAKIVERSFRDVKDYIMRLWPTYTGGSPEEKPEALKGVLKTDKVPTDEEFITSVEKIIEGYLNYQPYYGSVPEDQGKRRIDVYNEHLRHVRKPDEDTLRLMMLRTIRPQTVRREGIKIMIKGRPVYYISDELHREYTGKKVYARYDPDDLSSIRVYDLEDAFLMEVPRSELEAVYGASAEEIGRQERIKRRAHKAVQMYVQEFLPDTAPETALAAVLDMASDNLAGPVARKGTRTIELLRDHETPLAKVVGDIDIARMNRNTIINNGGFDDE